MKKEPIILNAQGRSLGRVASEAALLLRGKGSPDFERHIAPEQEVVITNVGKIRFTGQKLSMGTREKYTGYPSGLRKVSYRTLFEKNPTEFMRKTVAGMIPRNRLRKNILHNLTVYVSDKE